MGNGLLGLTRLQGTADTQLRESVTLGEARDGLLSRSHTAVRAIQRMRREVGFLREQLPYAQCPPGVNRAFANISVDLDQALNSTHWCFQAVSHAWVETTITFPEIDEIELESVTLLEHHGQLAAASNVAPMAR